MTKNKMPNVTISLSKDDKEKLDDLANTENRKRSNQIVHMMELFLQYKDKLKWWIEKLIFYKLKYVIGFWIKEEDDMSKNKGKKDVSPDKKPGPLTKKERKERKKKRKEKHQ